MACFAFLQSAFLLLWSACLLVWCFLIYSVRLLHMYILWPLVCVYTRNDNAFCGRVTASGSSLLSPVSATPHTLLITRERPPRSHALRLRWRGVVLCGTPIAAPPAVTLVAPSTAWPGPHRRSPELAAPQPWSVRSALLLAGWPLCCEILVRLSEWGFWAFSLWLLIAGGALMHAYLTGIGVLRRCVMTAVERWMFLGWTKHSESRELES